MEDPGRKDITALDGDGLAAALVAAGQPAYRVGQLERWLYERAAAAFDEMTDLPASLREELAASYYIPRPEIVGEASDEDGTTRYLFALHDGALAEAVFIPDQDHATICVSSQAGCRFGCRMCATGTLPFSRDLTAYEVFAQFAIAARRRGAERVRNAVFMGQGEPLANAEHVAAAVGLLRRRLDIGGRRITVSTVGLADGIIAWANEGPSVKMAVSLNSAVQETRDYLMPGVAGIKLGALAAACRYYIRRTRRRITFEYVLAAGVNDDDVQARALVAFTRGIPSKINVLPFNPWPGATFRPPTPARTDAFLAAVAEGPMALTFRKPRGQGVYAACGTLANRVPVGV